MDMHEPVLALGLMSGTSLDGIDAALLWTDGAGIAEPRGSLSIPYDDKLHAGLRAAVARAEFLPGVDALERAMTLAHATVVGALLRQEDLLPESVRVIGFHGQTLLHRPDAGVTWQIGDGALLAVASEIDVVSDFRAADIDAGGEGAPLAPVFHAVLAGELAKPVAVLNIGGVANVSWIGAQGRLLAFDTGPGNAMIDDWCLAHTGCPLDTDGALAAAGKVDDAALAALLDNPYFARKSPKSLDRNAFDAGFVAGLSPRDGAATLTAFTAHSIARAVAEFPAPVTRWLVCGGGRHNRALMAALADAVAAPVDAVEAAGWNGDALEAQAFAYLAMRSLRGLPLTFPATTGAPHPLTGGRLDTAIL